MTSPCVLITGFEPYGPWPDNPSAEVARGLDGEVLDGHRVVGRVLPVVLDGLQDSVDALMDVCQPRVVLSLGLHPGATTLRVERLAINCVDFARADNAGARPPPGSLRPGASPAHFATLPVHAVVAALVGAGIPSVVSNSAGTYLCNAALYAFLESAARGDPPCLCGFMHLPFSPALAAAQLAGSDDGASGAAAQAPPSMDPALVAAAARIALRTALAHT